MSCQKQLITGDPCYEYKYNSRKWHQNKKKKSISNGVKERYYNLEYPTGDEKIDELLEYFKDSDPYYRTETFPRIVELISAEDNLSVLSRWHKIAAKAGSIAEFESNM